MDITQVGTSLAIVVICYLVGLGAKTIDGVKDNYIPVIVGAVGGALGAAGSIWREKLAPPHWS